MNKIFHPNIDEMCAPRLFHLSRALWLTLYVSGAVASVWT
jgi:hypothetical protein